MPERTLREGILTSEAVNRLDFAAEVFYRRVMSKADDLGIYDARPRTLKMELYGYKDDVTAADCEQWLAACVREGLIRTYEHNDKSYLFIVNFGQRLRFKSRPKFPLPPWLTLETDEKGRMIPKCQADVRHVSGTRRQMSDTCLTRAAEEKRREEKRREYNMVVASTPLSQSGETAPPAPQALATTTTTFPEGFEDWQEKLRQAMPSLRRSRKFAPDVLQAALEAFDRCPSAADDAALLAAYFDSRMEKDRYGHTFYRPTGQAQFFRQLEDVLSAAERWNRETSWSKKNKNTRISHEVCAQRAFEGGVAQVATEEDKAAFSASMDEILGRTKK